MPDIENISITVKGADAAVSVGELQMHRFSSGERTSRAVKALLICWLLAVVTLFIPIAHFVLVPLFLIAGPVLAVMKYKTLTAMEKAHCVCPECEKGVDIELDPADKLPKRTYCPACNKPLQLLYHNDPSQS